MSSILELPSPAHATDADQPATGLVSVIIPAFNAGEYLQTAIQSILDQTYPHWELLVIDDGSSDGSVDAARARFSDDRIRWYHQPNRGKSVAMNLALRELRGEFHVLQDADDVSLPRRLELLVKALREDPDIAGVFSGYELIIDDRHLAPRSRCKSSDECRQDILRLSMPSHDPTGMYRTSAVRDITYNEAFRIGQGLDYILRVGEAHPLLVVEDVLYGYRIHPQSITKRDPSRRDAAIQQVLTEAAARRGSRIPSEKSRRPASEDNDLSTHFLESVQDLKTHERWTAALRVACQGVALRPTARAYYKPLALALLPLRVTNWIRRRKALRRDALLECQPGSG